MRAQDVIVARKDDNGAIDEETTQVIQSNRRSGCDADFLPKEVRAICNAQLQDLTQNE